MNLVRHGVTRTVLLVGRYAVKVPSLRGGMYGGMRGRLESFCNGILANDNEHRWSTFEGWDGQVAPVLHSWFLGLVNVYPRCDPVEDCEPLEMDPDPGDHKPDNYGLLCGRLVRVDYVI